MKVVHKVRKRTTVHAALCEIVSIGTGNFEVRVSDDMHFSLDLVPFACRLGDTLSLLRQWMVRKPSASMNKIMPLPNQTVSLPPMLEDYPEESVVGAPEPEPAAASSSALAPWEPINFRDQSVLSVCNELISKGALEAPDGVEASFARLDILMALKTAGVVKLFNDEFDVLMVRLKREGLQWAVTWKLTDQRLAARINRHGPLLGKTKMELMAMPYYEGWSSEGQLPAEWHPDGMAARIFTLRFTRPLSYFACLNDRYRVIEKVDVAISHRQCDAYYRCLLQLDQAKLAVIMDRQNAAQSNEWFRQQLLDANVAAEEEPEQGGEPEEPMPIAASAYPEEQVAVTEMNTWDRCEVSTTDEPLAAIRVFFDQCSGGDATKRRGFCVCEKHRCHFWKPVKICKTRDEYLAFMWLWWRHGCANKDAHLKFRPDPEDVAALVPKLVRRPF